MSADWWPGATPALLCCCVTIAGCASTPTGLRPMLPDPPKIPSPPVKLEPRHSLPMQPRLEIELQALESLLAKPLPNEMSSAHK